MATEPLKCFRDYHLRQVPLPLLLRVKQHAKREGCTVRKVLVRLLSQYASGCESQKDNQILPR